MIDRQMVLVLGAGASAAFGFPTGRELVTKVVTGLRKEIAQLFQLLQACGFSAAERSYPHARASPRVSP